ncbi:hypothetical protein C5167_045103 [Papaver somniferum]|uniref:Uncharacterized protein n=1 Tax=Papaver somniferum TaxID=3469 RepID=A0A4Y7LCQ3_PAPSO|nr:hypothetical protein C5167_045103 [Papaver somniferum]
MKKSSFRDVLSVCCFVVLVIVEISMMHNNHFFGYGVADNCAEVLSTYHRPSASFIQVKQYLDIRSRKLISGRRKLVEPPKTGDPPPRSNPPGPVSAPVDR